MSLEIPQLLARYIAAHQLAEAGREAVILDRLRNAQTRLPAVFGEWKIPFDVQQTMMVVCLGFSPRPESLRLGVPVLPEKPPALKAFLVARQVVLYQRPAPAPAVVATCDPLVAAWKDQLPMLLGAPVELVWFTPAEIEAARNQLGPRLVAEIEAAAKHDDAAGRDAAIEDESGPIVQMVDLMIQQAVQRRASDIHVEPFERQAIVRYRVDGVLVKVRDYAIELHAAVTSRLKLMAGMDIAEKRVPQDGRIEFIGHGVEMDLRVSSTPSAHGETMVMRLLARASIKVDLSKGGFRDEVLKNFRRSFTQANGIVLVTGPTGSGKTTTLYGMVNELNDEETKIFTIEDPIEYQLEGIIQIPVKAKVGLTFAAALRAALRQDPDIIMVGEIRDGETAEIAIKSALTGHLVLSTLHTNSAPATLTRLLDMGVEPYNVSATLRSVLAQRLVRKLCGACARDAGITPSIRQLFVDQGVAVPAAIKEPKGCDACHGTGYSGRMGVHEFCDVTEEMKVLINRKAPESDLRDRAMKDGMRSLLQDGLIKVAEHRTSLTELLRVVGGTVEA